MDEATVKIVSKTKEVTHNTRRVKYGGALVKNDGVWNLVALPLVPDEQMYECNADSASTHGPSGCVNVNLGRSIGDEPKVGNAVNDPICGHRVDKLLAAHGG
jgi:hypothetical protein